MTISRRSFLKKSAATAAVTMASSNVLPVIAKNSASGMQPGPGNKWPGRVVINFDNSVFTTTAGGNPAVDAAVVKTMMDDSIKFLTGEASVGAAWKAIFPSTLTASSTIAIKVPLGCATQKMAPHWSSVAAIVDGLKAMEFGGAAFPAANITIYDMRCQDKMSAYGYTNANIPGVKIIRDSNTSGATDGAKNLQYAKSLQSNFLINVFRPGGHDTYAEGLTLGFKNHYGTYAVDHNANSAPGHLRDINCTGAVFNKNVISICVGLFGAQEGSGSPGSGDIPYTTYAKTIDSSATGPNPSTIIMSTDPITAEMQTIKMMRVNSGKSYAVADLPKYLKASGGVAGSLSDTVYNIGVIDEAAMDIRKIINGERIGTALERNPLPGSTDHASNLMVRHLKNQNTMFIEYSVPRATVGAEATISIYDLKGGRVFSTHQRILGVVSQYSWNEKNAHGLQVPEGAYVIRVAAGALLLSRQVSILR